MYCAVPAFQHSDADLARDPLSTNRRLVNTEELAIFPTVNADSPVVLQYFFYSYTTSRPDTGTVADP